MLTLTWGVRGGQVRGESRGSDLVGHLGAGSSIRRDGPGGAGARLDRVVVHFLLVQGPVDLLSETKTREEGRKANCQDVNGRNRQFPKEGTHL